MADTYLPSSTKPAVEAVATHRDPAPIQGVGAVGDMMLNPLEWAVEYQKLAMEYIGEPEQVFFMNAARRFAACARVLPPPEKKPDGFVVLGDID